MLVVVDYYYNDLEQRCSNGDCDFVVGPYEEEWIGPCPQCFAPLLFYRAFGTVEERSYPVNYSQARISGVDY